jgi:hypothetical protein
MYTLGAQCTSILPDRIILLLMARPCIYPAHCNCAFILNESLKSVAEGGTTLAYHLSAWVVF